MGPKTICRVVCNFRVRDLPTFSLTSMRTLASYWLKIPAIASLRDAEPKEPVVDDNDGDEVFTKKPKTPTRKLSRTGTWLKPKVEQYA